MCSEQLQTEDINELVCTEEIKRGIEMSVTHEIQDHKHHVVISGFVQNIKRNFGCKKERSDKRSALLMTLVVVNHVISLVLRGKIGSQMI
jgi:hypothetical protein